VNRYLLVLTRPQAAAPSAEALGALAGSLVGWVSALRRWRLLVGVAVGADGPVNGAVVVTATDLEAARRLAASCPVKAVVLTLCDSSG
jgi:hypothetical protein